MTRLIVKTGWARAHTAADLPNAASSLLFARDVTIIADSEGARFLRIDRTIRDVAQIAITTGRAPFVYFRRPSFGRVARSQSGRQVGSRIFRLHVDVRFGSAQ